jgi:hypothetical protein
VKEAARIHFSKLVFVLFCECVRVLVLLCMSVLSVKKKEERYEDETITLTYTYTLLFELKVLQFPKLSFARLIASRTFRLSIGSFLGSIRDSDC